MVIKKRVRGTPTTIVRCAGRGQTYCLYCNEDYGGRKVSDVGVMKDEELRQKPHRTKDRNTDRFNIKKKRRE